LTATQNVDDAHDTPISRSSRVPVVDTCVDDHEWPLYVATVLGLPGIPLAPTAAQNDVVGHEILYVASGPTFWALDHE
jgi:hypothetical protein